jgi:hypothetical protein
VISREVKVTISSIHLGLQSVGQDNYALCPHRIKDSHGSGVLGATLSQSSPQLASQMLRCR